LWGFLLTHVDALVVNEVGDHTEALTTLGAFVEPLTSVHMLVPQPCGTQNEGLVTHQTLEEILEQVISLMFDGHETVAEALAALKALVGLFTHELRQL
jgi:hypothetical protein